jgi:hypothetical protein
MGLRTMYITRPRAKSFVIEVKRTGKRSLAPTSALKTSYTGSDLVERVFGSFVTPSVGRLEKLARPNDRAEGARPSQAPSAASVSDGILTHTPEPNARRVLPDLLAVVVDPVEERVKQQAEQRAAQRRALLESRRSKALSISEGEPISKDRVGPSDDAVREGPQPTTSGKPTNDVLTPAMRKARRAGLRPPRLPLGQRWKRRLPQACW